MWSQISSALLQAANPDLTIDQIMGMVDIAWQDNDREVTPLPPAPLQTAVASDTCRAHD